MAIINGTINDETLTGNRNENDQIYGDGGDDILIGLGGKDVLDGGTGADVMIGGEGDDTYYVDYNGDWVVENADEGHDYVYATTSYRMHANVEDAELLEGETAYNIGGNELDNTIIGNTKDNLLVGAGGDDHVYGKGGADTLYGGEGDDQLYGGDAGDTLYGDAGKDFLDGGVGADSMYGGAGDDDYWVDDKNDLVIEYGGDWIWSAINGLHDSVHSFIDYKLPDYVENLYLFEDGGAINGTGNDLANIIGGNSFSNTLTGNGGDDTLSGYGDNDTLDGGDGNDSLYGDDGNDTMYGGADDDSLNPSFGADIMYGGAGNDYFYVFEAGQQVIEYLGEGFDSVQSEVDFTIQEGNEIEQLHVVGDGLTGTGNGLVNWIQSVGNNNILDGGGGADHLFGNGTDTLYGGDGDDSFYVYGGSDVIIEYDGQGTDWVYSTVSHSLEDNVENLTLWANPDETYAFGNILDNFIIGNSTANTLDGGAGDDTLVGGGGNDYYLIDSAGDVVVAGNELDWVKVSFSGYTLADSVEVGEVNTTADTTLTGNGLANTLYGNVGNDTLAGAGDNDTLTGGDGSDHFVFAKGDGIDIITDFVTNGANSDIIELSGYGVASFAALQAFMSQQGADVVIAFDANNQITLQNVMLASLNQNDFLFA